MSPDPLRTTFAAALVVASAAVGCAPAMGQVTPPSSDGAASALQRLLWPSWSDQVAALRLGGMSLVLTDSAAAFWQSNRRCAVASDIGFAAGLVGDIVRPGAMTDLLDLSPRVLFHDAPQLRSLSFVGEVVAEAVVCPSPFARSPWTYGDSPPPESPGR